LTRKYSRASVVLFFCFALGVCRVSAEPARPAADRIQPLITTSELIIGENRFAFGLAQANRLVENADVLVRLYLVAGENTRPVAEVNAPYRTVRSSPATNVMHRHADGSRHVHTSDDAVRGLYVTRLKFPRPGTWGIELLVRQNGVALEPVRLSARVLENSPTPAVGTPAPRSRNLVAKDVKDLREIDTSARPDPRLHQVRIADAIAQGKSQLIAFATPQFCTSRMCGSVLDIVRTLLPVYGRRVVFTHQEIWRDFGNKKAFSTVEEWRLQSEPWIFVVDGHGIIQAKFEGLVTERELESALEQVLSAEQRARLGVGSSLE
jgi:hypothetical protein